MNTQLLHGAIKRVFFTKGFGFITGDDGRELFFHVYEVHGGTPEFERLTVGDRVQFYAEATTFKTAGGSEQSGWKALRVRPSTEAA